MRNENLTGNFDGDKISPVGEKNAQLAVKSLDLSEILTIDKGAENESDAQIRIVKRIVIGMVREKKLRGIWRMSRNFWFSSTIEGSFALGNWRSAQPG